jgi:valyl-tRNA synthetase
VSAADRKRLEETTRYDPAEVEARVFAEWIHGGYFHPEAKGRPAENYSVAIPPPNVTGALHMGHALNGSMQDALVRMNRMRGRNTLWILGTDHAGIATQAVVEKELRAEGKTRSLAARPSSSGSGPGRRSTARGSSSSTSDWAPPATTSASASPSTRTT